MQKRIALWQEISVVMLIKIALIFALWWLFFSTPLDRTLNASDIHSHLFTQSESLHES